MNQTKNMEHLIKQPLIENFLKHSGKVMEYGFAYIFAHPEHIDEINSLLKVIKDMQTVQARYTTVPKLCEQIIMNGYIDYIRRVTKYGFKYICNHPEVMKDVQELGFIYNEFEKQIKQRLPITVSNQYYIDESEINEAEGEQFFEECFNELNQLQSTIQSFESKINKEICLDYSSLATTSKALKNFNTKLVNELQKRQQVPKYRQRPNNSPAKNQRYDNENIIQNTDSIINLSTTNNKEVNNQTLPQWSSVSSKSASFEKIIECDHFDELHQDINRANNSNSIIIPTFKVHPPEKHIHIPIGTHNNDQQTFPIITTELTFTKPNQCNEISMNFKLGFKDGFHLQDKFINEINIHHKLPLPPRHTRLKHDIKLQN